MSRMPPATRDRFEQELRSARSQPASEAWAALERAHVLSQPWAGPHVRSHVAMLRLAVRVRDPREVLGQVVRALLAGPASLAGRIPTGNDGRARTPLTARQPVDPELAELLP